MKSYGPVGYNAVQLGEIDLLDEHIPSSFRVEE
jgi:hypothetical protein